MHIHTYHPLYFLLYSCSFCRKQLWSFCCKHFTIFSCTDQPTSCLLHMFRKAATCWIHSVQQDGTRYQHFPEVMDILKLPAPLTQLLTCNLVNAIPSCTETHNVFTFLTAPSSLSPIPTFTQEKMPLF